MSTVAYTAIAHVLVYGAAALALYAGLHQTVMRRYLRPATACVAYLSALALLPSLLMQAFGVLASHLFTARLVPPEAAWDVGLAMALFVSTWVCYAVGVLAACLGSRLLFKGSANAI